MIVLALAALAAVTGPQAAKKQVSAGPLGSAAHWAEGNTAAMIAEVAMSIQQLGPEDTRSLAKAGELLLKAGQPAEAEKLFAKAIALAPKDDETLGIIAVAYRDARKWDKVDELYTKATAMDPGDLEHVIQWGVSYWNRGDKAKAGELFAKVLSAEPESERLRYVIGRGLK
jgi:Flp pilus assembly protein TadD